MKIKKSCYIVIIIFVSIFRLNAYLNTLPAGTIGEDKFYLMTGVEEYFKKNQGSVIIYRFIADIGVASKSEILLYAPYISLYRTDLPEISTFGDLILYVKMLLFRKYIRYPKAIYRGLVYHTGELCIGFNLATGPNKEEAEEFEHYSIGNPDFRIGFIYGTDIADFFIDFNFFYIFAIQPEEDFLPFSKELWSSKKKSYLFDIHKVIVKLLWPGRYPWAPDEAPSWEKYPHSDDYIILNAVTGYCWDPDFTLFSYDFIIEFNYIQTWGNYSPELTQFIISPGVVCYFSDEIYLLLTSSLIAYPPNKKNFFYDSRYFMGLNFYL